MPALRLTLLALALTVAVIPTATAESTPLSWPIAFQEIYVLRPGEGTQLRLDPEGMTARRFHLRVRSETPIRVDVTRDYDGSVLFSERRTSDVNALIPWGRGERGVISIVNASQDLRIEVSLEIATDPAEEGEPVPGFYVNRFLELMQAGELTTDPAVLRRARGLLDQALTQDADDVVARRLLESLGHSVETTDLTRIREIRTRLESLEERGETDAIRRLLDEAPDLRTVTGRRTWSLLVGRTYLDLQEPQLALQAYYRALDAAPDLAARFDVYPGLVAANLAVGNTEQAEAVVERALGEAPDETTRAQVEGWIPD